MVDFLMFCFNVFSFVYCPFDALWGLVNDFKMLGAVTVDFCVKYQIGVR